MATPEEIECLLQEVSIARWEEGNKLDLLVKKLVELQVYPKQSGINLEAKAMVESYGAYWHQYNQPHHCKHCNTDLRDLKHGPPFKREIAHVDRDLDRVVEVNCPDCGGKVDW
jgi:hypothetical protein